MEVKLDKQYPLEASVEQAWAVLSDIRAVGGCMPGAQITEQLDETHYKGTVKTKVGPASMQFGGEIEVLGVDAAAYAMQMVGKGADRGGSSASMKLSAHIEPGATPQTSVLVGQATVTVSGKLAQFGSRLLVPVSDAMLAQFADNFRAAAAAVPVAATATSAAEAPLGATAEGAAVTPAGEAPAAPAPAGAADGTVSAAPAAATAAVPAPAAAVRAPAPAAPVKELNALSLMWTVFKAWLAGLFGRKS
jgi:carbon monoxide dehydrogenase subunit G